jgi:hypothetical protein
MCRHIWAFQQLECAALAHSIRCLLEASNHTLRKHVLCRVLTAEHTPPTHSLTHPPIQPLPVLLPVLLPALLPALLPVLLTAASCVAAAAADGVIRG